MALQAGSVDAANPLRGEPADIAAARPGDPPPVSSIPAAGSDTAHPHINKGHGYWALAIGSLGVVFGDIGTSPLYAFQVAMTQASRDQLRDNAVLGVVSLALWALLLVVTVKYVIFVMRADNKGEGGVLSLMALAQRSLGRRTRAIFILGLIGASLFYGDAIITPAMSVLGAFQGMNDVPALHGIVSGKEITIVSFVLLVGFFIIQARGTAKLATFFGPIMLVWFVTIAALGVTHIADAPGILAAVSPHYGVIFLIRHGLVGFLVLGSIFLTVTGAEALYADMGHFGRWPIQSSWLFFALPALALNYFGQGACALKALHFARVHHHAFVNADWFFVMAPPVLRAPLVVLAVAASVIASQAVISGAYSLSQQAILLGILPRMTVTRTSETQSGQIYMPQVNRFLMIGVLVLVAAFQTADNLADAYGLAVTGTMLTTTILAFIVVRRMWKWPLWRASAAVRAADHARRGVPGRQRAEDRLGRLAAAEPGHLPVHGHVHLGARHPGADGQDPARVGTRDRADRDAARPSAAPGAGHGHLPDLGPRHRTGGADAQPEAQQGAAREERHRHRPHRRDAAGGEADRVEISAFNADFRRLVIHYGFMETPNVPKALGLCRKQGLKFDIMATSFFLGRRSVVPAAQTAMPLWQDKLFIFLLKNGSNPTEFFKIPAGRVVELGAQVSV